MQKMLQRLGRGGKDWGSAGDELCSLRVEGLVGDLSYFKEPAPLAAAIAQVLRKKGGCARADIHEGPFSPEELDRHWGLAYALAQIYLI